MPKVNRIQNWHVAGRAINVLRLQINIAIPRLCRHYNPNVPGTHILSTPQLANAVAQVATPPRGGDPQLCATNRKLTSCTGAEVYTPNKECYTSGPDLQLAKTLEDACPGDLKLNKNKTIDSVPAHLYTCSFEALVPPELVSIVHDNLTLACENNSGQLTDGIYCWYCNAANTIATATQNTIECACKDGYTDDDDDMSNGCEASAQ